MPTRRPQKSAEVILNSDDLLGLPILDVLDKLRNNPAPPQQSNGSDPELDEDNDKADDDRGGKVSQRTPSPPLSKPQKQKHTEVAKETGPAPKIHYQLKIATKAELHKPPAKHNNQGAMLLLDRSEPWDTFKAQLLCKISKCLKPTMENFNDYGPVQDPQLLVGGRVSLAVSYTASAVVSAAAGSGDRIPMHMSILTGQKWINELLEAFYNSYVKLPPTDTVPAEICLNPHYWLFIKDCLGVVDGSLLDGFVPVGDMARYQSRLQMGECLKMLIRRDLLFLLASIILEMLDFQFVMPCWYHIVEYAIISMNGVKQAIYEYTKETQAMIPCGLAALHNFISILDPDDFAEDDADRSGTRGASWTLQEIDGDEQRTFPQEELGRFISPAEKARATEFQDCIAQEMWDKYVEDGLTEESLE
ncbi:hypothetical protein EYR40_008501 [Pleurotus pulmonarius]|nr:hypothetical protein EYR36_009319 [Pleurotus pulmonarius]KAF4592818.1 hypothetical protein EYR38_008520 [Pleurotus pulmonarius]KAF4593711.1 hypothetical protein EYR40_008501 [Pleurotus pulmonarius]